MKYSNYKKKNLEDFLDAINEIIKKYYWDIMTCFFILMMNMSTNQLELKLFFTSPCIFLTFPYTSSRNNSDTPRK